MEKLDIRDIANGKLRSNNAVLQRLHISRVSWDCLKAILNSIEESRYEACNTFYKKEQLFIHIFLQTRILFSSLQKWKKITFLGVDIEKFLVHVRVAMDNERRISRTNVNQSHYRRFSKNAKKQVAIDLNEGLIKKKKKKKRVSEKELSQRKYLEQFDEDMNGPLHEQDFVKRNMKLFHDKQSSYVLLQCQQCKCRWYAPSICRNDEHYMCKECDDEARKNIREPWYTPKWGIENKTIPGPPPLWAQGLTVIEEMLVSPILPVMTVFTVRGGAYKFKGNSINFMQHVNDLVLELPRLPSQIQTLIVRGPESKLSDRLFRVRAQKVREFCYAAKQMKLPGWNEVNISEENLSLLPEDGIPADIPTTVIQNFDVRGDSASDMDITNLNEADNEEGEELTSFMLSVPQKVQLEADIIKQFLEQKNGEELKESNQRDYEDEEADLRWPRQESIPVNEWSENQLASKCFPTLFANGMGDPFDQERKVSVKVKAHFKKLLQYAYQQEDGTWIYPFAAHPRFAFWAHNTIMRREAVSLANFCLRHSPRDQLMTVQQIKEVLRSEEHPPAFVRRIQRFGQSITGTNEKFVAKFFFVAVKFFFVTVKFFFVTVKFFFVTVKSAFFDYMYRFTMLLV